MRTDDLAAIPIRALLSRQPTVDWGALDDLVYGCANQAGEDNRNVARMALLLAGLPQEVPGATVNRLCGSALDAVAIAARAIAAGEVGLMIADGVESMSRAPFVIQSADAFCAGHGISRHDDRVALREPYPQGAVWHRRHAGDGGERCRAVSDQSRRSGCFCA